MTDAEFIPCIPMRLPEPERLEAAKTAIRINPQNSPRIDRVKMVIAEVLAARGIVLEKPTQELPDDVIPPQHLAVLTDKRWGNGKVDLTIGFMEPTDQALRNKILLYANRWGEWANIRFVWTQTSPQVRISREGDGYWSYLGTDILHIPTGKPTMNLQAFTLQTPDSEWLRVVPHEFGHTCGFPHEHMRKEIVQQLDPAKTIAWGKSALGWNATEVQQQILTPLNEVDLIATEHADEISIMCYQLPGSITRDGQPIVGGLDLSENDKRQCDKIYPREVIVTPPNPPNPPPKPPPDGGTNVLAKILKLIAALKAKDFLTAIQILIDLASGIQSGAIPVTEVDQVHQQLRSLSTPQQSP